MFAEKRRKLDVVMNELKTKVFTPKQVAECGMRVNQDGKKRNGLEVLAFPNVGFADICALMPDLSDTDTDIRLQAERDAMYANYISRQEKDVAAVRRDENQEIPQGFDYGVIEGLSNELRQKLDQHRPENLAQAGKIDGMTPSALALILFHLRRKRPARQA